MASADLFIRAGDTTPVFTDTILDAGGNAYNLTGKTVTFTLRSLQAAAPVALTGTVTVTNAAAGAVSFTWGANDTTNAGAGLYNAEWRVVTDGYTYPNDGYRTVSIEQALATAPTQLVSIADAKEYASIPSSDRTQDEKLLRFIKSIRPVVESITGPIIPQQFEEWHDGGASFIKLRHAPRTGYGTSPLLTLMACSEYNGPVEWPLAIVASPDLGQLYSVMLDVRLGRVVRRTAGGAVQAFPNMLQSVHVIYEAGQTVVPDNVYEGTCELIRVNYQRTQQAGRGGVVPAGAEARDDEADMGAPGVPLGFLVPGRVRELLSPTKRFPSIA